jgi:hypothetical protein
MRRDLERRSPRKPASSVEPVAVTRADVALELRELIEALDRRLPRVGRAGETSIAGESAALRERAVKRLAEIVDRKASSSD